MPLTVRANLATQWQGFNGNVTALLRLDSTKSNFNASSGSYSLSWRAAAFIRTA